MIKLHAVDVGLRLHPLLTVAIDEFLEFELNIEARPDIRAFEMHTLEDVGHIVVQPLPLGLAVLLPAGDDLFNREIGFALDLDPLDKSVAGVANIVNENKCVFGIARCGLIHTFVGLNNRTGLELRPGEWVVPLDFEGPWSAVEAERLRLAWCSIHSRQNRGVPGGPASEPFDCSQAGSI